MPLSSRESNGGFDLAAQWMGWDNAFQVEIDEFCQKVLAKNFPNTKRYGDIKQFDGTEWAGKIDILTGGFPCQPFSRSGSRNGKNDNRYLWPEMLRVINEIKPIWIVGENVTGVISMALKDVQTSLEDKGYAVENFIIPACAAGAPHQRDRLWICAHATASQPQRGTRTGYNGTWGTEIGSDSLLQNVPHTTSKRNRSSEGQIQTGGNQFINGGWWEAEPELGRVANGIPNRVDRIKSLGNAIVPQVAFEIFKAIESTLPNQE